MSKVAAIFGAGDGNGTAFAKRFLKEGYKVALLSRKGEVKDQACLGGPDCLRSYKCDVIKDEEVCSSLRSIEEDLGPVSTVVFNASRGGFKSLDQYTPSDITANTDVDAAGLYRVAVAAKSQLLKSDNANIVVIGATASLRGRPNTLAFAAGKAAQRSVAQSLARGWGPEKIHVSYVVIDGVISSEKVKTLIKQPDDFFLKSEDIADAIINVVNQKPSAWTFEFDVRPFGEKW